MVTWSVLVEGVVTSSHDNKDVSEKLVETLALFSVGLSSLAQNPRLFDFFDLVFCYKLMKALFTLFLLLFLSCFHCLFTSFHAVPC